MRFFPLKISIACLLLTPVLYVFTLIFLENYFDRHYSEQVHNILIGDSASILDGSTRLEERIAMNIDNFVRHDTLLQLLKLKIHIQVTTLTGKIIYPIFLDLQTIEKEFRQDTDRDMTARNNFEILNKGIKVEVETSLSHGARLANLILISYFGISFAVFFIFYRNGSKKAAREREQRTRIITELKKEEASYKTILDDLNNDRQKLFENIKMLNSKYQENKKKAKINEEGLFEEIISLEEQIKAFVELKQIKESEISELKAQIQKYERRKSSKSKRHEFEFFEKRFTALYKNIQLHRKAVTGFLGLNEDQQIKAEELIHQLDKNSEKVVIKRKVFSGKKHKTACFEVLFAYNGRLYFRKNKNNNIDVLVIGTKNSQSKDMEFLHSI